MYDFSHFDLLLPEFQDVLLLEGVFLREGGVTC